MKNDGHAAEDSERPCRPPGARLRLLDARPAPRAARPSARAAPTGSTSASSRAGPRARARRRDAVDRPDAAPLRRRARPSAARAPTDRRPQAGLAARLLPRAASSTARSRRTPPSCSPRRKRAAAPAARAAAPTRSPRCSTGSRRRTPLELRDRALFELAYACGLRAEELVNLDLGVARLRRRGDARRGQGRQDAHRAGGRAGAAGDRALPRARRARRCCRTTGEPALFLSKSGRRLSTSDVRRRLRVWARAAALQGGVHPARAAALVRDPSAGGRGGSAGDPGAARPRVASRTTQIYTRVESARLRARIARSHPRA